MNTIYLKNNESLSSALANALSGDTIVLEPRIYREKIKITTPELTIIGTDGKSEIVFGDYAKKIHDDGLEYNTFRTYTVGVFAKNTTFIGLTIENDAYDPKTKGQAVALTVYADNFKGFDLNLKSAQDTLFVGPLPDDLIFRYQTFLPDDERYFEGEASSLFKNCKIFGTVDYVFGSGTAFFDECKFINIDDGRSTGYVAAPSHSLKQHDGFTFVNCEFLKDENCNAEIFLARPWRDWGKATFICCKFGSHISPKGFDRWGDSCRNLTARFELYDCTKLDNLVNFAKQIDGLSAANLIFKMNNLSK